MDTKKMKDIPEDSRPYERCIRMGPGALSDEELLSVIIRTGSRGKNCLETARQILALSYPEDGILGLGHLSLQDLMGVEGIGTVKGIQLLCIGELSRRISKRFAISRIRVFSLPEEAVISPREIFIEAVRCRAAGVILVHNHPSGDPTPSRQDCLMTERVREAGNLLGIHLLDHVVIGDRSYCSFKREGKLA